MPAKAGQVENQAGKGRRWRRLGLVLACGAAMGPNAVADTRLYLQPVVDGQVETGILPVIVTKEGLKVRSVDLEHIGVVGSIGAADGAGDRLLNGTGAVRYVIDGAAQTIAISLPPGDILPHETMLRQRGRFITPERSAFGAYSNYDIAVTTPVGAPGGHRQGESHVRLGGALDFVFFSPWGEVISNNDVDLPPPAGSFSPAFARLSTTYEYDDPRRPAAFRLGDVITQSPGWARDDAAGGIQIATDDALQPGVITFPLPRIGGTLADASAVSLLVNNAQAYRSNFTAGPYALVGVPVVTGLNEITVQTRNQDGQISSTTVPFYASTTMLAPGLDKYSATLGYLRENYGSTRDGYRIAAFDGSFSRGLTDHLTLAVHGEAAPGLQLAGASLQATSLLGDTEIALAGSRTGRRAGGLASLQYSRSAQWLSLAGGVTATTNGYEDLAGLQGEAFPLLNWYAAAAVALPGRYGSLHLAYSSTQSRASYLRGGLRDAFYAEPAGISRFLLASYTLQTARGWSVSVALSAGNYRSGGRNRDSKGFDVVLGIPLGGDRRGDLALSGAANQIPEVAEGVQALPNTAIGWGGAALNETGQYGARYALLQHNSLNGDFDAQIDQFGGQSAARFQARGSVALLDGLHFSAPINTGFAVFDVGYPHIPVAVQNLPAGETDASGRAFLPGLLPYYPNQISVPPNALPLAANFTSNVVTVAPPLYGGVVTKLPVSRITAVLVQISGPDGGHPAPGAPLEADGVGAVAVGYDGEVLLPRAPARLSGSVPYQGGTCRFDAPVTVSLRNFLVAVQVPCALSH